MKTMKKILALATAMIMVFAMTITAFADEKKDFSITINNANAGHTYEAYQIFSGNLSEGVLSNIEWGASVTAEGQSALGDAKTVAATLDGASSEEAKEFAKKIADYLANPVATVDTVEGTNKITGLAAGYYLVKDKDDSLAETAESYTEYILRVVADVTATPKADTTTVEKKVKDTNDTTGATTDWQDSADYDIGDVVPFQLKATLASNVESYDTYNVVFNDTLSAGLTYNADYTVSIDGKDVTADFTASYEGTKLTFACADVKKLGATNNSVIIVEYTATLNENAVLGSAGNPNTVYLDFSNNPNHSGEGDNENGKTPEDTVIVFTYKVVVNKVDQDQNALAGAEFTLEKKLADGSKKVIDVIKTQAGDEFTFKGLDDGEYVLTETVTPDGYNSIDPIEFTVTADHDILSDNPALNSLNGNVTTGEISFTPNTTEGSLNTTVMNQKGSTLPSTGGAGRVLIYVVGAILVLGAGVVIIARKRAK
ncbi:MAG: isopeptide-forming domain-containing fimbrial protein [Agathobacter sp.]|nr:isopeptide-forming domain-containing fimbrial protein [Agathobacter sp.]